MLSFRGLFKRSLLASVAVLSFCIAAGGAEEAPGPLPDPAKLKEAEGTVREIFEKEYRAAKTKQQKSALARKLIRYGVETRNDPAGQYALLRLARNVASIAGDVDTAHAAIEEIGTRFQIDALGDKVSVLTKAIRASTSPPERKSLVRLAVGLGEEAVHKDRYDLARPLSQLARKQAQKLQDQKLSNRTLELARRVDSSEKRFTAVRAARAILVKNPTDATANEKVGMYLCLLKDDWLTGLPMLARSGEAALAELARLELKAPKTTAEQVQLGNGWWDRAASVKDHTSDPMKRRAVHWYRRALPKVTGLNKVRVQKRLQQAGDLAGGDVSGRSAPTGGLPRKSNEKTPASLSRSEKRVAGIYQTTAVHELEKDKKIVRGHTLELKPDRTVWQNNAKQIGTWRMDRLLIKLFFSDADAGVAQLRRQSKGRLSGTQKDSKGRTWTWQAQPVVLIAEWEILVKETGTKKQIKLYSNGRVESPFDKTSWSLNGNKLLIRFRSDPAFWTVNRDGRTLTGRWLRGAHITGRLIGP